MASIRTIPLGGLFAMLAAACGAFEAESGATDGGAPPGEASAPAVAPGDPCTPPGVVDTFDRSGDLLMAPWTALVGSAPANAGLDLAPSGGKGGSGALAVELGDGSGQSEWTRALSRTFASSTCALTLSFDLFVDPTFAAEGSALVVVGLFFSSPDDAGSTQLVVNVASPTAIDLFAQPYSASGLPGAGATLANASLVRGAWSSVNVRVPAIVPGQPLAAPTLLVNGQPGSVQSLPQMNVRALRELRAGAVYVAGRTRGRVLVDNLALR